MDILEIRKIISTKKPIMELVYDGRNVIEKSTGKFKEYCITNIDKVTSKNPGINYFEVYKDERVAIYQKRRSLGRVFVI